ncbi:MAG TPA: glycosyltransferase [Thermoanaerobaculia bacterium]|nr:glycosyltransferase [Thermoanaerobaculia bacterium]
MRILQFVNTFDIGGTERQVVNLTRALHHAGVETHLACLCAKGGLSEEIQRLGVAISEYPLRSMRRPSVIKPLLGLASYLRRHRIDVVHTSGFYTNVLGVLSARLAGTPAIIASVRDMGPMWTSAQQRLERLVGSLADAVVTNADAVAGRLRSEGWNPARIEVIHNGIEYAPPPPNGPDLRRQLGLAPSTPLVGVVTRLTPIKGVEDFIDAAAVLAPRHPDARFLVIGGPVIDRRRPGEYDRELARRAASLGLADRVLFTGWRSDGNSLLSQFTVSVLPSLTEGLSNVLIESLAAGVATVATTVGGNPEVVDDGVTGLLVPPANPNRLAAAIDRLLCEPGLAASFGEAGRRRYQEHFTIDHMFQRMMKLYRGLLEGAPMAQPSRRALLQARGIRR